MSLRSPGPRDQGKGFKGPGSSRVGFGKGTPMKSASPQTCKMEGWRLRPPLCGGLMHGLVAAVRAGDHRHGLLGGLLATFGEGQTAILV